MNKEESKGAKESRERVYEPPIPFPQRLMKKEIDPQFSKFLDMLKKIQVNIPFMEAIAQIPKYAKFLKELISNKKKLEEMETVTLTKECSALISNKLPRKLRHPGSLTIPCEIGNMQFQKHCMIWMPP